MTSSAVFGRVAKPVPSMPLMRIKENIAHLVAAGFIYSRQVFVSILASPSAGEVGLSRLKLPGIAGATRPGTGDNG